MKALSWKSSKHIGHLSSIELAAGARSPSRSAPRVDIVSKYISGKGSAKVRIGKWLFAVTGSIKTVVSAPVTS